MCFTVIVYQSDLITNNELFDEFEENVSKEHIIANIPSQIREIREATHNQEMEKLVLENTSISHPFYDFATKISEDEALTLPLVSK